LRQKSAAPGLKGQIAARRKNRAAADFRPAIAVAIRVGGLLPPWQKGVYTERPVAMCRPRLPTHIRRIV
jgi:hypothetical protein